MTFFASLARPPSARAAETAAAENESRSAAATTFQTAPLNNAAESRKETAGKGETIADS